mgnify:FL=1
MGATCPVEVIPNGVDLQKFQIADSGNKNNSEKVIITTSRLVYKNGLDSLIQSLAFLPSNVTLQSVIYGPGEEF